MSTRPATPDDTIAALERGYRALLLGLRREAGHSLTAKEATLARLAYCTAWNDAFQAGFWVGWHRYEQRLEEKRREEPTP